MDFSALEYEIFIDKDSESTFHLIFKKIPLDEVIYQQTATISIQIIKMLLLPTIHFYEAGFSSHK